MSAEFIENKIGKMWPSAWVFAGYISFGSGVLFLIINPMIAIPVVLIGWHLCFAMAGTQIDWKNKKYRNYNSCFGIKLGKWHSCENFPYIAVLKKNLVSVVLIAGNVTSSEDRRSYYDICLLSKSQRQKYLVRRLKDPDQANKDATELADQLNLQKTTYNPVISAKTKARR